LLKMQFTQVSELNADINAVRVGVRSLAVDDDDDVHQHYTSPVYHDKDSEISKLLNGSPPLESFFLAEDYHPAFLTRSTSARQHPGVRFTDETPSADVDDSDDDDDDEDEHDSDESINSGNSSENEQAASPQTAATDSNKPVQSTTTTGAFAFKRAAVPGWDVDVDAPKEDAEGHAKPTFSGVSALLGPAGTHSKDTSHAAVGPQMDLIVYLPDRSMVELLVPKAATVEASIKLIVQHVQHQRSQGEGKVSVLSHRFCLHPICLSLY
jgi:hypothetical protein